MTCAALVKGDGLKVRGSAKLRHKPETAWLSYGGPAPPHENPEAMGQDVEVRGQEGDTLLLLCTPHHHHHHEVGVV